MGDYNMAGSSSTGEFKQCVIMSLDSVQRNDTKFVDATDREDGVDVGEHFAFRLAHQSQRRSFSAYL